MKRWVVIETAIVLLAFILFGCGVKAHDVSGERYHPTGIMPEEAVVFLLNESKKQFINIETENEERSVERCLQNAIRDTNSRWKIITANEFRHTLFPGKNFVDVPHSAETLLLSFQDKEVLRRAQSLGIRYLIVIEKDTHTYGEEGTFAAEGGIWGVGQSWTRYSHFLATIIDVKQQEKSGFLLSTASGQAGYIIPFFVILPLPPVPLLAATESKACSSLGSAVVNFIEGKYDSGNNMK